jgi:DNA-binding CsgD family transcriptional regulator
MPRATFDGSEECALTSRQLEVLTLVALGLSTDRIACELFLTPNTIRKHVRHILDRLCARNRPHAVALAISAGLISIDDHAGPQAAAVIASGRGGDDHTGGARALAQQTRVQPWG